MADLLSDEAITAALATMDGWQVAGSVAAGAEIMRTVQLPSFPAAIGVVDRVAEVAEEMDHHPDIDIRWRQLTFRCSTHSKGGVTELDLRLAGRINEIVSAVAP
jgi:4a-hydroxytetrahydrobiopterin dehydratase